MKSKQSWAGYSSRLPWMGLIPGLICFAAFLLYPLVFTTYLAFYRMQSGHWLNHDQVRELLLQEVVLPSEQATSDFTLSCSDSSCRLFTNWRGQKLLTTFRLDSPGEYKLTPSEGEIAGDSMPPEAVFALSTTLSQFVFETPNGERLRYFRSDLLAPLVKRFMAEGESDLREAATGKLFQADFSRGAYVAGEEELAPGFSHWVGFSNFSRLFQQPDQWFALSKIIQWTFLWALMSVLLTLVVGGGFALALQNEERFWKPLLRVLLIIPYAIPFFISVLIFKSLMNSDFGLLNTLLKAVKLTPVDWLTHPLWAKVSCLAVNTWLGFPYMLLVVTGILQAIPRSQYEAAALENASRRSIFWRITWPQVLRGIGPTLIGTFAFNMNNFVGIYLLTGGGPPMAETTTPAGSTDILLSYTYRLAFEGGNQDFGLASAVSIIIFVVIAVMTVLQLRLLARRLPI